MSVMLVHRSDQALLRDISDLTDETESRFAELTNITLDTTTHREGSPEAPSSALLGELTHGMLAHTLNEMQPMQRSIYMEGSVMRILIEVSGGAAAASPTTETPVMEAGIDSLASTELTSRLHSLTGVTLSPTLMFEQPTPRAIAAHLLEQMSLLSATSALPKLLAADSGAAPTVNGQLVWWPGGGDEGSAHCKPCADIMLQTNWVVDEAVDTKLLCVAQASLVRNSGSIAGARGFDGVLGLSLAEVTAMDPGQRLVLELGYVTTRGSYQVTHVLWLSERCQHVSDGCLSTAGTHLMVATMLSDGEAVQPNTHVC